MADPIFFATPEQLRAWFDANHERADELWLGYHKRATGRPSVTWSQAVDEALCVGWIDGRLQRIDEHAHMQRFTPRKPSSTWSKINVAKVERLTAEGRMRPAGLAAFERRRAARSGIYSYEQPAEEAAALAAPWEAELRERHPAAWAYFEAQPPSYRRTALHKIVSAKREDTRRRRFGELVEASEAGRWIKGLWRPGRG
ncbi:MAG TPA: YdeI/OmpD-associated family protein [Solirubrobacteraceae bacterium]